VFVKISQLHQELKQLQQAELLIGDHIQTLEDVQTFMSYHVFAVWDFMTLLKCIQRHITEVELPWFPKPNGKMIRLINSIVLDEESDFVPASIAGVDQYMSHFELYIKSMEQINAPTIMIDTFLNAAKQRNITHALYDCNLPESIRIFVKTTMEYSIGSGHKPHLSAAAFAYGRETIIPEMFTQILRQLTKSGRLKDCSYLIYYLERHVEIDGNEHGDKSIELLEHMCDNNQQKMAESLSAAIECAIARRNLWEGIILKNL